MSRSSSQTAPAILVTAHGAGASALLRAETPDLDELPPLNEADTATGLALAVARGRPFQRGNRAASGRGPSLTRGGANPDAPEERQLVERRAATLRGQRRRELAVQHGAPVSSGVLTELVAWARGVSWSDVYYRAGDAVKGAALAEKASAHQLRAIAIAEREARARPQSSAYENLRTELAARADALPEFPPSPAAAPVEPPPAAEGAAHETQG